MTNASLHFHNSLGRTYCLVRYDQMRHVVVAVWRGLVTPDSRTEVWQQLLAVLYVTGCPRLFNNWQDFWGTWLSSGSGCKRSGTPRPKPACAFWPTL